MLAQVPIVAAQQTPEQKAVLAVVNQFVDGFNAVKLRKRTAGWKITAWLWATGTIR